MLTYSGLLSGSMVYFTINWSFSRRLPLIGEFHISNCKFTVSTIFWNPNSSLYNKEYYTSLLSLNLRVFHMRQRKILGDNEWTAVQTPLLWPRIKLKDKYSFISGTNSKKRMAWIWMKQDRIYQKKRQLIEKYVKNHKIVDYSRILNEVDIDYDTLMKIISELRNEGRLKWDVRLFVHSLVFVISHDNKMTNSLFCGFSMEWWSNMSLGYNCPSS